MQVNIQNKNFTLLEIQGRVVGQDALVLKTMLEEHIQTLEAQGGPRMALVNVNKGIKRMLIRTNLTSLFDFPKNLADAIAKSF